MRNWAGCLRNIRRAIFIRFVRYPTCAVVDRKGIVRAVGLQPDHVESMVKKLLAEPAP